MPLPLISQHQMYAKTLITQLVLVMHDKWQSKE